MWYVIRGDYDGLDYVKCISYDVAVVTMLQQMASKIDIYGIYCDNFEVDRYKAYVSTKEGFFAWMILEAKEGEK